jgi:DNA-binding Lrp family transcriptional regulator
MLMTHSIPDKGMMIPMSQQEIGDMLGLTNVTVSRELKALQVDDLIEKDGFHIRIKNLSALIRMCEFKDRYNKIDTAWLPK